MPASEGELYFVEGPTPTSASVVKVDQQGNVQTVHAFTTAEGESQYSSNLLRDDAGNVYGMNTDTQTSVWIHRLTSAGVFTKLATFTIQEAGVSNPLVLGPGGVIYGTLSYSGPAKQGSIYRLDPNGTVTILANFPSEGMLQPGSLMLADDGNLYGTTRQIPSYIFRYGPTSFGTIFSFDAGLAPPKPRVKEVRPSTGTVGTRVLLWGNNLLGAISVTFNGTPAATVASTDGAVRLCGCPGWGHVRPDRRDHAERQFHNKQLYCRVKQPRFRSTD